jgi:cellobiose dehydrogenase (acceptor)
MAHKIVVALALGVGLVGGQSTAFTDPQTGITYQQISREDYTFGVALPEKPTGDFIGRISAKGSQGWAGVSLGGRMTNSLMVVAWPHENKVVSSLRHSMGYASPGPNANASISLKAIPAGTSFDGKTYTYTFLCKGCAHKDRSTFAADASLIDIGYGYAAEGVTSPANTLSTLSFHSSGFGLFGLNLANAKSPKFATWAAMARDAESPLKTGDTIPNNHKVLVSNETYDYIVVGGGPSGLITSQRLTETGRSVLLIERGLASTASTGGKRLVPWNQSLTYYDVPGLFESLPTATRGEGYCTDTASVAGCILGGGGSVNGMAFIHPPSWDFDDYWPAGWKWSNVAPAAARLYARNPGTTLSSRDGKYHDNEVYTLLERWFTDNGWNFADGIQQPENKTHSFGHPQINVGSLFWWTELTRYPGRKWPSLGTDPHISTPGAGQIHLQAAAQHQSDSRNP